MDYDTWKTSPPDTGPEPDGDCPKCGADLEYEEDLPYSVGWVCTNSDCDYENLNVNPNIP